MPPKSVLLLLLSATLLFTIVTTAKSHNQQGKFKNHLIQRLLEKTRPTPDPSGEDLTCLSCLLQLYLDKPLERKSKPFIDTSQSKQFLTSNEGNVFPLTRNTNPFTRNTKQFTSNTNSFVRNTNTFARNTNPFTRNTKPTLPKLEDGFSLSSPEREVDEWRDTITNNYLNYEFVKEGENFSDFEENYFDELPNELASEYSAHDDDISYDIDDSDYREHASDSHTEMCKTRQRWKLLNETRNQRGEIVKVLPRTHEGRQQFVYMYECEWNECERCRGISRNSRCRMRDSYLNLYHEVNGHRKYGYVEVPTHCTCELLPKYFYPEGCAVRGKRDRIK